jgi:elongation factor Ts
MAITASDVKELRERSGAGMLDCKKALEGTNGDIDEAIDFLRKKGIGKASKKMDRLASEGLVGISVNNDNTKASLCELNSETDFVAKNEGFISLVQNVTNHILDNDFVDNDALMASSIDGVVFNEFLPEKASVIGERLVLRRFEKYNANSGEIVNGYLHVNGRIGVLLTAKYSGDKKEEALSLLKNISMHAAAMAPVCLSPDEVSKDFIDKEMDIAKEELKKANKPEAIWDKILGGKEAKLKQENSLLGQSYVMDNKLTIQKVLEQNSKEIGEISIIKYIRFELGEGLEKKSENFADEVAQQLS